MLTLVVCIVALVIIAFVVNQPAPVKVQKLKSETPLMAYFDKDGAIRLLNPQNELSDVVITPNEGERLSELTVSSKWEFAFVSNYEENTGCSIKTWDMLHQHIVKRTSGGVGACDSNPTWSPDGTQLAFLRYDPNKPRPITIVDLMVSDEAKKIEVIEEGLETPLFWYPKLVWGGGKPMLVLSENEWGYIPENAVPYIETNRVLEAIQNPDGKLLTLEANADSVVYSVFVPTQVGILMFDSVQAFVDPVWTKDGKYFAISDGDGKLLIMNTKAGTYFWTEGSNPAWID